MRLGQDQLFLLQHAFTPHGFHCQAPFGGLVVITFSTHQLMGSDMLLAWCSSVYNFDEWLYAFFMLLCIFGFSGSPLGARMLVRTIILSTFLEAVLSCISSWLHHFTLSVVCSSCNFYTSVLSGFVLFVCFLIMPP